VLSLKPNATLTHFELIRSAIVAMLLTGNAYLYPRRDSMGDVVALELLHPHSVAHETLTNTYTVNDPYTGVYGRFQASEIVHFRNLGLDGGRSGLSTVRQAGMALGLISAADEETGDLIKNGGRYGGFISGENGLPGYGQIQTKQLDEVRTRIEEEIGQDRLIHVLPGAMKWQQMTMSPKDAEILQNKVMSTRDVCRFFRVDPSLVYESTNNTYKSGEFPQLMFLVQTLEPMLCQMEEELTTKLVPEYLWSKHRVHISREPMYTTDLSTKASYYSSMLGNGIFTVNDLRRKEGLPPIDGGNTPLISANVVPLTDRIANNNATTENNDAHK
jgi:HK97 family phage portal protein